MEEKVFAPCLREIKFSDIVIQTLEKLRDGKRVLKERLTPKELNDIGLCYWYGHIVSLDYTKAVRWYKLSAQQGCKIAEFNLYVCYDKGTGVKKDERIALEWLKKAARHGYPNAQDILAECYFKGEMVRKSRRYAQHWFNKAEKSALVSEDEITLNSFGMRYLSGECGYVVNTEKAIGFFEKAGELDFPLSMSFLISIYIKRCDVEKVEYWINKLRKCKTKTRLMLDRNEKAYSTFMEGLRSGM